MTLAVWEGQEGVMKALHLIASVESRRLDLGDWQTAQRLWACLRRAFPVVLAVTLMLDHLHLVTWFGDVEGARLRLKRALAGCSWGRGTGLWKEVEPPKVVVGQVKIKRDIRYVGLNPCRAGLARDPLEWMWSTYRDAMGASVDPWVTPRQLAPAMGYPLARFGEEFHGYISGDPSVAVDGTPLPVAAVPCRPPEKMLAEVQRAAVAAVRGQMEDVRQPGPARELFVALAVEQGWDDAGILADICGISRRAVRRIRVRERRLDTRSASLCLGDSRLVTKVESG